MAEDVRIRHARGRADFDACVLLEKEVWGLSDLETSAAIQLMATTHAGGLLQLAETAEGRVVGFAYAFPALLAGAAHLHSDMLAVLPEYRSRGLGLRLKWAQREEALARGITLVTWTFDPLQVRNANLNLRHLGAVGSDFLEDFYGTTSSSLHHGLPTDRLLVRWELNDPRVVDRAQRPEIPPTVTAPSFPRINDVTWQQGWPITSEPDLELDALQLLLEVPPEWNILCQAAPRVAETWHGAVRRAFRSYFDRGYVASDFAPTEEGGRRRPFYVLGRTSR
jgi:predicted GNAT superfamily acetyltransferase